MTIHIATDDRTLLPRALIKRPFNQAEARIVRKTKAFVSAMHAADEMHEEELARSLMVSMDATRERAARTEATTPELAVLQLAMAIGELDRFDAGWIADDDGELSLRQIQRLAASVLSFLERETGVMREDVSADYFAGNRPATN
ncbi:hypothetical protein ABID08_006556 [Rhizobium binae]|uniref:Tail assembly chaperone n=1 Tax=Rhizobium binae TaxID=1138190 RepID=A0ABV2MRS4_9HYPH|nr:hypothetical protein [Rhizobium binae]MBX4993864.1 hypothetical protein [Rhizobium binae]NKL52087.1 hypothetical protein [Rhizobium leguminosarum bv. viciae]QSY83260.1 hypothetical protein J2J99_05440 [Rhizobium binae]